MKNTNKNAIQLHLRSNAWIILLCRWGRGCYIMSLSMVLIKSIFKEREPTKAKRIEPKFRGGR